ncbi:MAG TPA: DUF84 family protein [Bacillota bacterium]|nr:DUF84 family protein [Bacillota bacterium]
MKIVIGSKNTTKIEAVQHVFTNKEVIAIDAPSKVNAQPFSDAETKEGAINRATLCVKEMPKAIGIGLEGGVMEMDDGLYVCNWGALVTPDARVFTASGARIPLPPEISEELYRGFELGDIMDRYTDKNRVREKEGAVGIFTNEHVKRDGMFIHVVKLLRGQLEYWSK